MLTIHSYIQCYCQETEVTQLQTAQQEWVYNICAINKINYLDVNIFSINIIFI